MASGQIRPATSAILKIAAAPKLQSLRVNHFGLALAGVPSLEKFHMESVVINDPRIFSKFYGIASLKTMTFDAVTFTHEGTICRMCDGRIPRLESLAFHKCNLPPGTISCISRAVSLKNLTIMGISETRSVGLLVKLQNLVNLIVIANSDAEASMVHEFGVFKSLEYLSTNLLRNRDSIANFTNINPRVKVDARY